MKRVSISKLLISLGISFLAGGIGSLFTYSQISSWYSTLQKPFFTPPNGIFGPVWTTLYFLMGVAFYSIWMQKYKYSKKTAIYLFILQLILNTFWSVVFFGFHLLAVGFFVIVCLFIVLVFMAIYFRKINITASYLLFPYLLWVGFASLLNLFIVFLN